MVHVLFLFLTHFCVNVARSNGNPTRCIFQSYHVMFSRQKLMHAYNAFMSYVGCEGHIYEVLLVLAKTRLIFRRNVMGLNFI